MEFDRVRAEISRIRDAAGVAPKGEAVSVRVLFDHYVECEKALKAVVDKEEAAEGSPHQAQLKKIQDDILHSAAMMEAPLIRDALVKIALWRWSSESEISPGSEAMTLPVAVLYSAFRDLVEILGDRDLLTDEDLVFDHRADKTNS